jgi:hypothetical protein
MDCKIVSISEGRSGGVILLWKKEIKVEQIFAAPNYIDVRVVENIQKVWRLTGIYGEPPWEDKYKTWDKMRELKENSDIPWIVMGDFNKIAYSHKKEGGNRRPQNYMQAFMMYYLIVSWKILATLGNHLLGGEGESERGWTEQWQQVIGSPCIQGQYYNICNGQSRTIGLFYLTRSMTPWLV